MPKWISLFFLLFLAAARAQIVLNPDYEPFDKNRIEKPAIRSTSPFHRVYGEYDMSEFKEKKLERQIKVIFDVDQAQQCSKIAKLTTPGRVLASYVSDRTNCELSIKTLMDIAQKKGADTLYIGVIPNDCKLGAFLSYALKCEKK